MLKALLKQTTHSSCGVLLLFRPSANIDPQEGVALLSASVDNTPLSCV